VSRWRNLSGQTQAIIAAIVVVVLALAGYAGYQRLTQPQHQIALFVGAPPGTTLANTELRTASADGFNSVISYAEIDAKPAAVDSDLREAQRLHIGVWISLDDLLGPVDRNSDNVSYDAQYGHTTDAQVAGVIARYNKYPAVVGYFISDEMPGDPTGPDGLKTWLPRLIHRNDQVKQLSGKPTLVSLYWGANRLPFMQQVKTGADQEMMDYYPYPYGHGQTYGGTSSILPIGQALRAAAGSSSWFSDQAFSYNADPSDRGYFHFPANSPAPPASVMVHTARLAVQGGAYNLAFFSYEDAAGTPGQLGQIKTAVREIRATVPGFAH
jgi:hypothetical protein